MLGFLTLEKLSRRIDPLRQIAEPDAFCVFTRRTLSRACQDNMQMSRLTNHHIIAESKSPAGLNEEGHQFCSLPLKGSSGRCGCQNEWGFSFTDQWPFTNQWPRSFEVSLSIKSSTIVSALGWMSKLDKNKGLISHPQSSVLLCSTSRNNTPLIRRLI